MMKYNDIPKLKRIRYRESIPVTSIPDTLRKWEKDQADGGFRFYLAPDFRRGHVWTQAQQALYIEWLLRGGETGRDFYFNHSRRSLDYADDMFCVDGLQRLMAICRFLNNEFPVFGGVYYSELGKIPSDVDVTFHVGEYNKREMLEWYLELNQRGTPHSDAEMDKVRQMIEAYYE